MKSTCKRNNSRSMKQKRNCSRNIKKTCSSKRIIKKKCPVTRITKKKCINRKTNKSLCKRKLSVCRKSTKKSTSRNQRCTNICKRKTSKPVSRNINKRSKTRCVGRTIQKVTKRSRCIKRRNKKQKKGPKRPRNAYVMFFTGLYKQESKKAKIQCITDFVKCAGQLWRNMDCKQKKPFLLLANKDLQRYNKATKKC